MKKYFLVSILLFLVMGIISPYLSAYDNYDLANPKEFRYHPLLKDTSFQVVFDVEDPCFEILSGNWQLSKSGSYNNYYYYDITGPGDGSGKGRWIAEGLPQGSYLVEFYANNGDYASDARYQVICQDGVQDLSINMNYISSGWHTLGTFNVNRTCVVNISDYWEGSGTLLSVDALRFTLQTTLPSPPSSTVPPHIGICIDDAGNQNPTQEGQPIYKMLRLPFKMTFAVMPYCTYTNQSANEIYNQGSEVILHQPMAAISVPNPGAGGITDAMTLEQVRTTVATNLDNLPHVIGMNNHMGSLITQQEDKMQVCIEELEKRDLFFYDSRTITKSVGYDIAKDNGLLTGERDLFIDGSNKDQSKNLIRSLAQRALHAPNLTHLAIGHVRTSTADALTEMASELSAMGVEVWPISKCMAQVIETDYTPDGCSVNVDGNWQTDPNDCYCKELHDDYSMVVDDPATTRSETLTFIPSLVIGGKYDIYTRWWHDDCNTSQGLVTINHDLGVSPVPLDQNQEPCDWFYLGRYSCSSGTSANVQFSDSACTIPDKKFRADAVKFVYNSPSETAYCQSWSLY